MKPAILFAAGPALLLNQIVQLVGDIEDARVANECDKPGRCIKRSLVGSLLGVAFSAALYFLVRPYVFSVIGLVTGSYGIFCKIDQIKFIWQRYSIGLTQREKCMRAITDVEVFISTGMIAIAACHTLDKKFFA